VGTSGRPPASRVVLWLVAFVVGVGAVSLLVTGAGRKPPTPPPSAQSEATPGPTPVPLNCRADQLQMVGAFDECASPEPGVHSCSVTTQSMAVLVRLSSPAHRYELDIEIAHYAGPADYGLSSGAMKVEVREDTTGGVWRSVIGDLNVSARDGRSGTVNAVLEPLGSNFSDLPLSVVGPWSCD
jgi:hypothetical protein